MDPLKNTPAWAFGTWEKTRPAGAGLAESDFQVPNLFLQFAGRHGGQGCARGCEGKGVVEVGNGVESLSGVVCLFGGWTKCGWHGHMSPARKMCLLTCLW